MSGVSAADFTDVDGNAPDDRSGFADPVGANGNLSVAPLFPDVTGSAPFDRHLHVATAWPLVDAGDPSSRDPDFGPPDLGAWGGPEAIGWDLDGDGYDSWWRPGPYDAPTSPSLDCDDADPAVCPGSGC